MCQIQGCENVRGAFGVISTTFMCPPCIRAGKSPESNTNGTLDDNRSSVEHRRHEPKAPPNTPVSDQSDQSDADVEEESREPNTLESDQSDQTNVDVEEELPESAVELPISTADQVSPRRGSTGALSSDVPRRRARRHTWPSVSTIEEEEEEALPSQDTLRGLSRAAVEAASRANVQQMQVRMEELREELFYETARQLVEMLAEDRLIAAFSYAVLMHSYHDI